MAVTFVLGRAGSGKTRYCLDALARELAREDDARRLLLIVPEQAAFQMERELACRVPRGGYWRAEVVSFSRLAQRIFNEIGFETEMLRPSARRLALRTVLERSAAAARVFGSSAETPGFLARLDRLIEELMLETIRPEDLERSGTRSNDSELGDRARALATIYKSYLHWLGNERLDPAQRQAALRERLEAVPGLDETSIWVDGFAGFTGEELETLTALGSRARDLSLTHLLDPDAPAARDANQPPNPLDLFYRTETTYRQIRRRFQTAGIRVHAVKELGGTIMPRFRESPALGELERRLALRSPVSVLRRGDEDAGRDCRRADSVSSAAKPGRIAAENWQAVRVIECATHLDEIRAAAHYIRETVRQEAGALRYRDLALIARDLSPLADAIADVFTEYDIPHFIDRRRSLASHALVRFTRALFETLTGDFRISATSRWLQCDLLPLDREQAETLENLIVENEIQGLELWRRANWEYEWQPQCPPEKLRELHERRSSIVAALEPLIDAAQSRPGVTGAEWAQRLYAVFKSLGIPERLRSWSAEARGQGRLEVAEMHRLAWESWCELLEDLHAVHDSQVLDADAAASLLGAALDEMTVGLAPPTLDQVLISSIERSRHPDIKYAWIMAFNEGIFPAQPGEDHLLTSRDRERLAESGLSTLRSRREEVFAERLLAYIALTRPSLGLTISYAAVNANGDPLGPSTLLSEILELVPEVSAARLMERDPLPTCTTEFARNYLEAKSAGGAEFTKYRRLRAALKEDLLISAELERLLRGIDYRNAPMPIPGYARSAHDPGDAAWSGSPTQLDCYIQCPFKHFAQYALRLNPRRRESSEAPVLGRRAHAILAQVVEKAIGEEADVRAIGDEEWLTRLEQACRQIDAETKGDLASRRPRQAFFSEAQLTFLREGLLAQAARWRRGDFRPLACERVFRPAAPNALNALSVSIEGGRMASLHGFIDRLDECDANQARYLVVFDYKTTVPSTGGQCLTQARLQALTYLLAVEQAFASRGGSRPAGVFFVPLYPKTDELKSAGAGRRPPEIERMMLYRPRGWFDEAVAARLDRELGQEPSPVAAMKLRKDGEFDRRLSRDVLPSAELHALLRQAEQTILYGVESMSRGVIDVAPLLEAKRLACLSCDYASLCRYESAFNRPRRAETTLPTRSAHGANEGDQP